MDKKEKAVAKIRQMVHMNRFKEARALAVALVRSQPRNPVYWRMRGDLHLQLLEFDAAIECIQQVITLQSRLPLNGDVSAELYRVLGTTLYKSCRIPEAIQAFDQAMAAHPGHARYADTCCLRSMCYSLLGDFERGWPGYEYRRRGKFIITPDGIVAPEWQGEPLNGKSILVWAEQGYGDTIQFVRYLDQLKAIGGRVTFACQPLLMKLLSHNAGANLIINRDKIQPSSSYDVQIPLMSLLGLFHTTLNTIPCRIPYIHPMPDAGKQAKKIITDQKNTMLVGLVWRGNTQKDLSFHHFNEIFGVEEIKFFSLQKGQTTEEFKSTPSCIILSLVPHLHDFADTAAAIQELDLVISVDTVVAHLAGALGKPVWTLLPFAPDWRWMLNREDSPWYPTMRLFRQPALGDWASVIKRVAEELKALVETKK